MAEKSSNKKLYQLVGLIVILAGVLIALVIFYQNKTKPLASVETTIPAGIKHIFSIYGVNADDNFNRPESTALDKNGNIYVADTGNHRIAVFDKDGNFNRIIGNKKELQFPLGVALSDSGNIYVSSMMQKQVTIYDKDGKIKNKIKFEKKEEKPIRVVVYKNKLYITTIGKIIRTDLSGKIEKKWGKMGVSLGTFRYPNGVAFGEAGKLKEAMIVSDTNNNRIQIFTMDGKPKMYLGRPPKSLKDESLEFGLPSGLAVNEENNIYVSDAFDHAIVIFDKDGNKLGMLGKRGSDDGTFYYPSDIKHIKGNRFVISDKWNDRIQVCDLTVGK